MMCKLVCWTWKVLWALALLALILAWVAVSMRNLVFGLEPLAWFWNALVLGVLALGAKGGSCDDSCKAQGM